MGAPAPIGYCTLHLHGGDVQLDLCDLASVDPYNIKWTILKKGNTKYAIAKIVCDGAIKNIYMHRLILGHPTGHTDHIDRDGLNNRRFNLRVGSAMQNWVNSGPRARGKSRFKGVSWSKTAKKWRATIQAAGKWQQLGVFASEEDAARSYDKAAEAQFGPTAYLNRMDYKL